MSEKSIESLNIQEQLKIEEIIRKAPDRISEQIDIQGEKYQPSDGDMVELPGGLKGGINIAIQNKDGLYEVELESGLKVEAPANKLLLIGCWTAHKRHLIDKERSKS